MRQQFLFLTLFFFPLALIAQTGKPLTDSSRRPLDSTINLGTVQVRGSRPAASFRAGKTILRIAANPVYATSTNLMDILRKAPGVRTMPDGQLLLDGGNTPVVFINGKPSELPASEVQAYLTGLSPEQIESVELIPNPSSRYDGQYKAIIDIKLKRSANEGWSGNIGTSLRQNRYFSSDQNLNLAFRTKKTDFNLGAGYVLGTDDYRYNAFQRLASSTYLTTNTQRATDNNNLRIQLSTEHRFDEKSSIDLTLRTFQANRNLRALNTLEYRPETTGQLSGLSHTVNQSSPAQQSYTANLGYQRNFSGDSKLNIFGTLSDIENRQMEDIQIRDEFLNARTDYWKTNLNNTLRIATLQADYNFDINKAKLELGAKYAHTQTDNDLRYDTLGLTGDFALDPSRTNRFRYKEYISAGYMNLGFKAGKIDFRLGMRMEHTRTSSLSVHSGEVSDRQYWTVLPSLMATYANANGGQFVLNITRRMTRPGFDQLNPFRFYFSPLNFWVGNPDLRAAVTSLANISYSKGNWNISLSVAREHHMLTRFPRYDPITNELQYLGTNLPYRDYAVLESSYAFSLKPWWKLTNTLGIYYNKQQMPYLGTTYAIPIRDISYAGSQVFTLPAGLTADVSYRYQSRSGNSLYVQKGYGSVDVGLQRKWLGNRLTSKVNVYDLAYTQVSELIFREKQIIDNQFRHRFGTRRLMLSLQYDLSKIAFKSKNARTSDEEKRVTN